MTKKPKTIEGWEKVCHNLNSALKLSIDQEDELIKALEAEKAANKLLQNQVSDMEQKLSFYQQIIDGGDFSISQRDAEIKDLNITITKSAGIINYLEHKLERANSV
jgi:predicted RNase H-like nuclease (RuvC/YqgF family)